MTNRNYNCPKISARWSETRETHPAVAAAIHAISTSKRSPEAIWTEPTGAEWDHVAMAVEEYIEAGEFEAEPDGQYPWGQAVIEGPRQ